MLAWVAETYPNAALKDPKAILDEAKQQHGDFEKHLMAQVPPS
jgi:hypothetical protein